MPNLVIEVGDDIENIRSDLDSDSAEKVYPDLPNIKNDWSRHEEYVKLRINYLKQKDLKAYLEIKNTFPGFKPPDM
tara:strand:+ start:2384 stop:2611 length:228 start_codon:yes stop_codon:yes gene_type:complete